jgi:hypothetical protein
MPETNRIGPEYLLLAGDQHYRAGQRAVGHERLQGAGVGPALSTLG